jgi:hypothetical protein
MSRQLPVALTRAQVEGSPGIDTRKPVSRQHEEEFFKYYGYPMYWGGAGLWGLGAYPGSLTNQGMIEAELKAHSTRVAQSSDDCIFAAARPSSVIISKRPTVGSVTWRICS